MILGKYVITRHAIEQYDDRVTSKNEANIIACIKRDLRTLNIKNIVYKEDHIHVFTKGYKEFIFARGRKRLFLKTIIKRNQDDTKFTIDKRKNLVTN